MLLLQQRFLNKTYKFYVSFVGLWSPASDDGAFYENHP